LVLSQCAVSKPELLGLVPGLNDVPVIDLAADSGEFPALQWRR
jgi:hypothetical protein